MPRDTAPQSNVADADGLPEQHAPSEFDLIDQCVDRRLRERFEEIGLTAEKANALGLNLAALDIRDVD